MASNCLISVSVPGTNFNAETHPLLLLFKQQLENRGIEANFADTISGWGCLNQSFLEFYTEIETSYDWIWPLCFTQEEWYGVDHDHDFHTDGWCDYFRNGHLIMIVHYVVEENGEKKYIPYH